MAQTSLKKAPRRARGKAAPAFSAAPAGVPVRLPLSLPLLLPLVLAPGACRQRASRMPSLGVQASGSGCAGGAGRPVRLRRLAGKR